MNATTNNSLTVTTTVNAPINEVWKYWTSPEHIIHWNFASPDWHCPNATNDLLVGGKFSARMEAKDGSMGFDFSGTYTEVSSPNTLKYLMEDGRNVEVSFVEMGSTTAITESFEPENSNPLEMQQMGWQAILDNFKQYVESRP